MDTWISNCITKFEIFQSWTNKTWRAEPRCQMLWCYNPQSFAPSDRYLLFLNLIPRFSLQLLCWRGRGGGGCEGGDLVHVRPVPVGALQPAPGQAHALPLRQRHRGGEGAGQGRSALYFVIKLFIFISQTCNDDGCYGTCKTNGYCFKNVKRNETHVIKTYE